jgi:hypothetical protein
LWFPSCESPTEVESKTEFDSVLTPRARANAHHAPEDVAPALELSLQNLGLDYSMHCHSLELYMIDC